MKGTSRIARGLVLVVVLALVVFSPGVLVLHAQGPPAGMPDLVGMLRATPGCLGVDAARTTGGKQVIFAWFESKKAVLAWYYSAGHQQLTRSFASGGNPAREPLADIPEDSGAIMVIASMTMSDTPRVAGLPMPVSQLAIELYAPLPGGLAAGGRFAPGAVKVKGMIEAPMSAPRPAK
jgi:hypothetical protein